MKSLKKWLFFVLCIISPLIVSALFITIGHPDENGRYSVTGETTSTPAGYDQLVCESQRKIAESAAEVLGTEVPQDSGSGCTPTNKEAAQLGAGAYYDVDVSTPAAFVNAVNGKGFDEGYGYQCVAGFKEFMYALSGRYVATNNGGANGYATQQAQIQQLGFTWHSGTDGMQDGDWAIWGTGTYGHVAMYYQGKFFGQNQAAADPNRGNAFNLLGVSKSGILGYYRPNIYQKTASNTTENNTSNSNSTNTSTSNSYTVQRGDTLGGISLNLGWWPSVNGLYGDSGYAQRLADKNSIQNRGVIYPNQVILRAQ